MHSVRSGICLNWWKMHAYCHDTIYAWKCNRWPNNLPQHQSPIAMHIGWCTKYMYFEWLDVKLVWWVRHRWHYRARWLNAIIPKIVHRAHFWVAHLDWPLLLLFTCVCVCDCSHTIVWMFILSFFLSFFYIQKLLTSNSTIQFCNIGHLSESRYTFF